MSGAMLKRGFWLYVWRIKPRKERCCMWGAPEIVHHLEQIRLICVWDSILGITRSKMHFAANF